MKNFLNLTQRKLIHQLSLALGYVLTICFHYLFIGKDTRVFQQVAQDLAINYEVFLLGILGQLIISTSIPVVYCLYLTYAQAKDLYTELGRNLWGILLVTSLLLTFFTNSHFSIFMVIAIIIQLVLIINNTTISRKEAFYEIS